MKKGSKSYKVIIDTNIWISFLIGKSLLGLQRHLNSQSIQVVTCKEQIQELSEVFRRPKIKKYFSTAQFIEFLELLDESAMNIDLKTKTNLCRDPKDNYLISLAIDSKADYLITGDNDLLDLIKVENTEIVKYSDFDKLTIK